MDRFIVDSDVLLSEWRAAGFEVQRWLEMQSGNTAHVRRFRRGFMPARASAGRVVQLVHADGRMVELFFGWADHWSHLRVFAGAWRDERAKTRAAAKCQKDPQQPGGQ